MSDVDLLDHITVMAHWLLLVGVSFCLGWNARGDANANED